jgi:hypothetical protein
MSKSKLETTNCKAGKRLLQILPNFLPNFDFSTLYIEKPKKLFLRSLGIQLAKSENLAENLAEYIYYYILLLILLIKS